MEIKVREHFENPRRICHVEATPQYQLLLTFDNGEIKRYDMREQLYGVFAILKDEKKFMSAFVDECGNVAWDIDENNDSSSSWNNRIDLCKDMLYMESISV